MKINVSNVRNISRNEQPVKMNASVEKTKKVNIHFEHNTRSTDIPLELSSKQQTLSWRIIIRNIVRSFIHSHHAAAKSNGSEYSSSSFDGSYFVCVCIECLQFKVKTKCVTSARLVLKHFVLLCCTGEAFVCASCARSQFYFHAVSTLYSCLFHDYIDFRLTPRDTVHSQSNAKSKEWKMYTRVSERIPVDDDDDDDHHVQWNEQMNRWRDGAMLMPKPISICRLLLQFQDWNSSFVLSHFSLSLNFVNRLAASRDCQLGINLPNMTFR